MAGSFTEYLGFSKIEMEEQILDKIFINKDVYLELYNQLEYWYNGFNLGKDNTGLFNAFSVMSCLNDITLLRGNYTFRNYWSNTMADLFLK